MKTLLSARAAAGALLVIITLTLLFHGLVISGVIPFQIVWGGRISSREQLLVFEAVSVGLNLLMLAAVAARAGLLRVRVPAGLLTAALWLMAALFALNTVGNLLSNNELEKLVFTPLTLLLALLSLRLALAPPAAARA
ncbi:hypothetical protein EJV47_14895 [Hymenobacter gummosus]|uniref:Uncharacterized protein n=1 Tax=Hymenobacter gummosus TaxID=1776032 RepID=A0A431U194_9BACT|nr:hypothetical protein [Hymenobacter gummosus]RTQ48881.1 hypothetical protein EJV47_14895 [Hymenobacter gummosus]